MENFHLLMFEKSIVTKIYLIELIKAGYPPESIIILNKKRSKKAKFLQSFIGEKLYSKYKSLKLSKKNKEIDEILQNFIPSNTFSASELNFFDKKIKKIKKHTIETQSINNKQVVDYLKKRISGAILTAGVGLIKDNILNLPNIRFINIHSGLVPEYKGNDTFFYSLLNKEDPGCSVFYIDQGVDTGDVIYKKRTPFNINAINEDDYNLYNVYLSIKSYVIPYFKIRTFIEYLNSLSQKDIDMANLNASVQIENIGRTYFKLHKEMHNLIIKKLLSDI